VGRRAVQHAGQRRVAAAQLRHAAAQRRHGEAFRPGVQAFAVASQVCRRTSKAQPVTDTGVCICSATYVRTASKGTTRGDRDHEGAKTASLGAAKASYLSCSRKQTRPHDLTHLLQSCCSPKVFHTCVAFSWFSAETLRTRTCRLEAQLAFPRVSDRDCQLRLGRQRLDEAHIQRKRVSPSAWSPYSSLATIPADDEFHRVIVLET
jgi:hypothetical protein